MRIWLKLLCAIGVGLTAASPVGAQPERLALLIGISDYDGDGVVDTSPDANNQASAQGFARDLRNPVNDVTDLGAILSRAGFSTTILTDASKGQIDTAIAEFGASASAAGPDAVIIFYFAGHGISFDGEGFLVPSGAKIPAPRELPEMNVEGTRSEQDAWLAAAFMQNGTLPDPEQRKLFADAFISQISIRDALPMNEKREQDKGFVLFIFDNCRDYPYTSDVNMFQSVAKPMSNILPIVSGKFAFTNRISTHVFIFSAEPAQIALDGTGRNSVFATALKRRIARPLQTVSEMMLAVTEDVRTETENRQSPVGPVSPMDTTRICIVSCPPMSVLESASTE